MAPFYHFFFFCFCVYESAIVLLVCKRTRPPDPTFLENVLMTCFHANTELCHRGVAYTWALAASCSFKEFGPLAFCCVRRYLPNNLKRMWNADVEAGESQERPSEAREQRGRRTSLRSPTVDLILVRYFVKWVKRMRKRGGLTDQLSRIIKGGGERQSSCFWIGRNFGWGRRCESDIGHLEEKLFNSWYAVDNVARSSGTVAGNQPKKNPKQNIKSTLCFLSDQEDVLGAGWSV